MSQQAPEALFAGKFRLVKMLGRGAMGEVWLADEVGPRGFSRQVAVKRLLATEGISDYARESFLAEAQVIARLDHPNIVHLIELGESDDRGLYLVLDYIDGAALDRVIRRGGPLSAGATALIGREVAKALDAVHTMTDPYGRNLGVVHRDVSPANILIGRDGRIRLSDFGVARIHGLGGEKTETGVFKGKLPYMPPEQALGEPFDGRADVFSLGITIYEALLGGRLRKAETQGQLIAIIATERVPMVRETIPDAMPELAAAIDMATEFKSASRTPSAGHLAGQMHSVLYHLGPTAEQEALNEICERVAHASGATAAAPRQPWSMALTNENSAYGSGVRAFANPQSGSLSGSGGWANPPTSPSGGRAPGMVPVSVPPEGPGQASVTKIASITDTTGAATSSTSGKTWAIALGAAIILGCGMGAVFVFLSPPKPKSGPETAQASVALVTSAEASAAEPAQAPAPPSVAVTSTTAETSATVTASVSALATTARVNPTAPVIGMGTLPTSTAEETGSGSLLVLVNPWGNVSVDGKPYGTTPMGAIPLPAGPHTVVVTNPELGATRSAVVKVMPNKQAAVKFDLEKTK